MARGMTGRGTRARNMEGPDMKGPNTRDRGMGARPTKDRNTKDRNTKARHTVAHDTKVQDTKDHGMGALTTTAPLVVVRCATPTHCPMQVPSRLPAATVPPTYPFLPQKQSLGCQGQLPRNIACRTLRSLRIITLPLSNQNRPHAHSHKSLQSGFHFRPREHPLMPLLRNPRS
jgi:hypothetical protein